MDPGELSPGLKTLTETGNPHPFGDLPTVHVHRLQQTGLTLNYFGRLTWAIHLMDSNEHEFAFELLGEQGKIAPKEVPYVCTQRPHSGGLETLLDKIHT